MHKSMRCGSMKSLYMKFVFLRCLYSLKQDRNSSVSSEMFILSEAGSSFTIIPRVNATRHAFGVTIF